MTDRRTFLCEDFEISYEDTKKGWSMPYSHHHTNYEIYILLSGERLVTIGDITYRVEAGMASLFESNISHRSVGDTDYTGICIHFSKALSSKILFTCRSIFLPDLFQGTDYFHSRGLQTKASWTGTQLPAANLPLPTCYLAQILTDLAAIFAHQYPLRK